MKHFKNKEVKICMGRKDTIPRGTKHYIIPPEIGTFPVVQWLAVPCNVGDAGLTPGSGNQMPHATEQSKPCAPQPLSLLAPGSCMSQLESPGATTKVDSHDS